MAAVATLFASLAASAGAAGAGAGAAAGAAGAAGAGMSGLSALSAIGTAASIGGTILGGITGNQAAKQEAAMRERQAAVERADASRRAEEERRKATLVMSRQTALAATSGAGTQNPTILDIMSETAQRGSYLARSETYGGEDRARGQMDMAAAAKAKGRSQMTGSFFDAFGEGIEGASSFKKLRMQGY